MEKKFLFYNLSSRDTAPMLTITPALADRLLASSGASLAELDQMSAALGKGKVWATAPGAYVNYQVTDDPQGLPDAKGDQFIQVIGVLPGSGANTPSETPSIMMDQKAIIVAAHFDGLGVGPDGTFYEGANDNASSIGEMLEMARVLVQGGYEPKKTILFIAWTGGDRYEELYFQEILNASTMINKFDIETVIELNGVGAGTGKGAAITQESSYRLVKLYQEAASKMGMRTTTRGRGPHFGLPTVKLPVITEVPKLQISWDGSDAEAHTPRDTFESIDPKKIEKIGETTLLVLSVLSREINY